MTNTINTPHAIAIALGWDHAQVAATAEHGVSEADESALEAAGCSEESMVDWCREQCKVAGQAIQRDHSGGHGHCWRNEYYIPADIREEIAAEIIDGRCDSCDDYKASNGQHYRW